MTHLIRRTFFVLMLTGLAGLAVAGAPAQWLSLSGAARPSQTVEPVQLLNSSEGGFGVSADLIGLDYTNVETPRGLFTRLEIPGGQNSSRIGEPMLPILRRIIAVPFGAEVNAEVISADVREITMSEYGMRFPIVPAQPSMPKNVNPEDWPFEYQAAAYATGGYGERPLVSIEDLGTLRALRLMVLVIEPVRYNPVAGTLQIYTNLQVDVSFTGGDLAATAYERARTVSPYFEALYSQWVLNYRAERTLDEDLTRYPIKYAIVADPMFTAQLQPFIQWKTRKGYNVVVGYTNVIGNTTTAIKTWIQNLYNGGTPQDPAPTFVLFVGDVAQIPGWTGDAGSHTTDNKYARLAGSDVIPDVYYGRFSANNTSELQPQIDKTLQYEQYTMPDPSFLGRVVMIAGVDASYGQVWANGQINYGTENYFNAAHGITSNTYLYPQSGSQDAQIIANVSDGRGFVNYTAHGSQTSWADPTFTITDINNLANNHKYPTVVGNCCLTNSFQVTECFGEAWLRRANKGAIGYIGASNNSYWNEDYYWGVGYRTTIVEHPTYDATRRGAYDGMFHDHGETFPNWYTTQFGINMAGNLAVTQGGTSVNYYWEIYHLMGDPSLSTYLGVPTANTVSYPQQLLIGQNSIVVTAQPYSYVGLSFNNSLVARGLVDQTGSLTLNFTPFSQVGNADIVITRQNRIPVIAQIQIIPNTGPYVTLNSYTPHAGIYGAVTNLNVALENVGSENAQNVVGTLSISDPMVSISDATESYGTIAAGATVTRNNAFAISFVDGVPDQHLAHFTLTVTGNAADTWISYVDVTAQAPALAAGNPVINDASGNNNGRLDPGESVSLTIPVSNTGHAASVAGLGTLTSSSPYITITDGSENVAAIAAGGGANVTFTLTVSGSAPIGTPASFTFNLDAGAYDVNSNFVQVIGLVLEDWETGNFTRFPWQSGGNLPWVITNQSPYEGTYCAKSGAITHSQTSDMSVTLFVTSAGPISFYYKVSSEANYDYLRFFIDGVQQAQWAGEIGWTQASFNVTSGSHTFLWRYYKDGSVNSGSDCAWVDYIVFPAVGAPQYPDIDVSPASFQVTVSPGDSTTRPATVSNTGQAELTYAVSVSTSALMQTSVPNLKLAKGEKDPRRGERTLDAHGGPDAFGYRWVDSDDTGGPTFNWVEISGIGTAIPDADDSNNGPYNLGFTFSFYGVNYTQVRICTNGWLSFTSTSTAYSNQGIPNSGEPNAFLAPFWDDLNPVSAGTIYYYADAANQRFIAEWSGVAHYSGGSPETFQAIINADGSIVYQYQTVGLGTSCTVGIENASGTDGLQVVFNAAYLHNGLAIRFTAVAPWLTVTPLGGTVTPGGNATLTVKFNARTLTEGTYNGNLRITSNDPDEATVNVPVVLIVSATLDPVVDLTVISEGTGVRLTWSAAAGATRYNVYRSDTFPVDPVPANLIGTVTGTTYLDNAPLGNYRFYVVTSVRP